MIRLKLGEQVVRRRGAASVAVAGLAVLTLWAAAMPLDRAEARIKAAFEHPCPIKHVANLAFHHDCGKGLRLRARITSVASRDETDEGDGAGGEPPPALGRLDTGYWPVEWARGHVTPTGLMLIGTVRMLN